MPSTDTKPELTAKASMAQPVSQPAVYANGLSKLVELQLSTPCSVCELVLMSAIRYPMISGKSVRYR
jgi:hypothetical protein